MHEIKQRNRGSLEWLIFVTIIAGAFHSYGGCNLAVGEEMSVLISNLSEGDECETGTAILLAAAVNCDNWNDVSYSWSTPAGGSASAGYYGCINNSTGTFTTTVTATAGDDSASDTFTGTWHESLETSNPASFVKYNTNTVNSVWITSVVNLNPTATRTITAEGFASLSVSLGLTVTGEISVAKALKLAGESQATAAVNAWIKLSEEVAVPPVTTIEYWLGSAFQRRTWDAVDWTGFISKSGDITHDKDAQKQLWTK
jgi:hypothetical protein